MTNSGLFFVYGSGFSVKNKFFCDKTVINVV